MKEKITNRLFVGILLTLVLLIGLGTSNVFAATVEQVLISPDVGWTRYDDTDSRITYSNNATLTDSQVYKGSSHYLYPIGSSDVTAVFKFYGTQLRIISQVSTSYLTNASVQIDSNAAETYSENYATRNYQVLVYEKTGLPLGVHTVKLTYPANSSLAYSLDAIDIDSSGYLTLAPNSPTLNPATASTSKVDLSWSAVPDATSYNVKRSTISGGSYTTIASNITTTSYSDTYVTNGITYYYVVSASNSNGESPNSNEVSATPVSSTNVILVITLVNGTPKEYDMTESEFDSFLNWYDNRANGTGKAYYKITKKYMIKPFINKYDYVIFDKILDFEVNEYNE